MFICDYHVHTNYSGDADQTASMEKMVLSAIEKGVKEIALTDHIDLSYPPVDYGEINVFDFAEYNEQRLALREKYKNDIYVVLGAEMGLQARVKGEIDDYYYADNKLDSIIDFAIGSTHVVDYMDLYDGSFFKGKTQKQAFLRYFEDVYTSVTQFDCFDVYGHLDFINRYGGYPCKVLAYTEFSDIVDTILRKIIEKGKGIEVNSSGLRYGVGTPHPSFEFVKRYRELGGEILTTGSDAHTPKDVAAYFGDVYDMIRAAGFTTVTTFKNHKPSFVKI